MPTATELTHLLVAQARGRSARRATTLPVLATLTANAAVAELELRARDHEQALAVLGLARRSVLRTAAGWLPGVFEHATGQVLRADRMHVAVLTRLAATVDHIVGRCGDHLDGTP